MRRDHPGDLDVSGPDPAGPSLAADLVDEVISVVHPVAPGAGLPFWPALPDPRSFRLTKTIRFASGVVALRYERSRSAG